MTKTTVFGLTLLLLCGCGEFGCEEPAGRMVDGTDIMDVTIDYSALDWRGIYADQDLIKVLERGHNIGEGRLFIYSEDVELLYSPLYERKFFRISEKTHQVDHADYWINAMRLEIEKVSIFDLISELDDKNKQTVIKILTEGENARTE